MRAHVHTELRFLPVSEKELKRFYPNKHAHTKKKNQIKEKLC